MLEQAGKVLSLKETPEILKLSPAERFRNALAEMGPTFVKLGQILATRVDLFPSEWIKEFEKLQDRAPVVPFELIKQQLFEDLGAMPEDVFLEFDPNPLAAASIGQVHRARLKNGNEVIVKVRRPGVDGTIESDLRLLSHLAKFIESESEELRQYRPVAIVKQFTKSLNQELDLVAECRHTERVAKNFARHQEVIIPKIYWEYTSKRINVQELIHGIPGRNLTEVDQSGLNRKKLADLGAGMVCKMILEDGFFHADPHPGNIFYLPENRIAMIDFGMVGRLSQSRRAELLDLLYGLIKIDSDMVVDILINWTGNINIVVEDLKQEIDKFIDQYHGVPLKQLDITSMLTELTDILREYRLTLPPDLTLMIKALITLEGMALNLDPGFDMAATMYPYLQKAMKAKYSIKALTQNSWKSLATGLTAISALPRDLRQLFQSARNNQLQVHVDLTRLQQFGDQLDRAASRMTIGLITGALIVGSSTIMTANSSSQMIDFHLIGFGGYVSAAIFGIWLLLSIRKSGRK